MLAHPRHVEAGGIRAHVEGQGVERKAFSSRVDGAPGHVDPLGHRLDQPGSDAARKPAEIERQIRLAVHALEKARHHAGVVVVR